MLFREILAAYSANHLTHLMLKQVAGRLIAYCKNSQLNASAGWFQYLGNGKTEWLQSKPMFIYTIHLYLPRIVILFPPLQSRDCPFRVGEEPAFVSRFRDKHFCLLLCVEILSAGISDMTPYIRRWLSAFRGKFCLQLHGRRLKMITKLFVETLAMTSSRIVCLRVIKIVVNFSHIRNLYYVESERYKCVVRCCWIVLILC